MNNDIWGKCNGKKYITSFRLDVYRAVESQEQIATANLVDTLEEQIILEELIDATKPKVLHQPGKHYLLTTPFRYPPLKHGSRFGNRSEPSLFYASRLIETALAETAYYRLVFLSGLAVPWQERLLTEHSTFAITIETSSGLNLQSPPFDQFVNTIASPIDYAATQQLGTEMRNAGVEAFLYISARDKNQGINCAAFTPDAIRGQRPKRMTQWLCTTTNDEVVFQKTRARNALYQFTKAEFCVAGKLPQPAL